MGQPRPLFCFFSYFQEQILQKITVGFGRIRTRIVTVEGKHADHLTTTTAHCIYCFGAVFVAQLADWLLPIPEVCGSNPVIGKNFYRTFLYIWADTKMRV